MKIAPYGRATALTLAPDGAMGCEALLLCSDLLAWPERDLALAISGARRALAAAVRTAERNGCAPKTTAAAPPA